jgi:hypothetical protein
MGLGNKNVEKAVGQGLPVSVSQTKPDGFGNPIPGPAVQAPKATNPRTYSFAYVKASSTPEDVPVPCRAGNAIFVQYVMDQSPGEMGFVFDDERSGLVLHQNYAAFTGWLKILGPQFSSLKIRMTAPGTYILRITVWENPDFTGKVDIFAS